MTSSRTFTILCIDDVQQNLHLLSALLTEKGWDVIEALNGKEGIREALDKIPDLILLDVAMPEMDGFEVCSYLKNEEKTKNIPIIFLTAINHAESIILGFESGAVDYVTKPFNIAELLSRVTTHIELKDKSEQLEQLNQYLEQKVTIRTDQLELANRKLGRLDKAKNDFISLISHELRTPLNGIIGFGALLERTVKDNKQVEFIREINKSAERLKQLAELAILITSLKADSYKIAKQNTSLKEIINILIEKNSREIELKQLSVLFNFPYDNLKLSVDKELVENCFNILLNNSIKHSVSGSQILVSSYLENDFITTEIVNKGSAFNSKFLESQFDLFEVENVDYHSQGFGLGLYTAKLIADTLDGKIQISNLETEIGAKVMLSLPIL